VLALEEEAGANNASYAIRNLISAKKLTIESTIKTRSPANWKRRSMWFMGQRLSLSPPPTRRQTPKPEAASS
jgi:hypothetical protein